MKNKLGIKEVKFIVTDYEHQVINEAKGNKTYREFLLDMLVKEDNQ